MIRTPAWIPASLILAVCTACTTTEGPVESPQASGVDEVEAPVEPTPPSFEVVVGSVSLEQDCPDPTPPAATPPADAAPPASRSPAAPSAVAPGGTAAPPAKRSPGSVARRACRQSRLQLQFENPGSAALGIRVVEVRLRDLETKTVVATLDSRLPTRWSEADNAYAAWDEQLPAASSARASYSIKPPSWSTVEGKLDGADSRERTFTVEVTVDGGGDERVATSAEFTRPPVVMMPPT